MDKSILNIETVSNADIQNAEFYIAVNNSFVKAPFELLKQVLQDDALISDTSAADNKTLSAMKIYQLLEDKMDGDTKITFQMLDDTAKSGLLNYIEENVPIEFDVTGRFIDNDTPGDTTTYSSNKLNEVISDLDSRTLKSGSVEGVHISDDAMDYIVQWIKDAGISFENIPATGFRFSNVSLTDDEDPNSGKLVLTPINVPFTLLPVYQPSNANRGKQLLYTVDNSNISVDSATDMITVNTYDAGSSLVTAALIDTPDFKRSFTVVPTKKAFTANLTGTPDDTAGDIPSSNGTGVILTGGVKYGASGGISSFDGTEYQTLSATFPITEATNVRITMKMQDVLASSAAAGQTWIRVNFGGTRNNLVIQLNSDMFEKFQSRVNLYMNGGTRVDQSFYCLWGDNDGIPPKSMTWEIVLNMRDKKVSYCGTGYLDNEWTTLPNQYTNGKTVTFGSSVAENWNDETLATQTAQLVLNESKAYGFTVPELTIAYA